MGNIERYYAMQRAVARTWPGRMFNRLADYLRDINQR